MRLIEDILERVLEEMPHLQADIDDSCGFCTEEFVQELRKSLERYFHDQDLYPIPEQ